MYGRAGGNVVSAPSLPNILAFNLKITCKRALLATSRLPVIWSALKNIIPMALQRMDQLCP
jgi:hypothetical protein